MAEEIKNPQTVSDYTKTKRKMNADGTYTFITGGSRFGDLMRDDVVSKMGKLSNADIATTRMPDTPPEISRKRYKKMREEGLIPSDEELKKQGLQFIYKDEEDDSVTHVWYGNKKYPKNSKLFPGDLVEGYFPNNAKKHKLLGQVVHVRSFSDWTISVRWRDGDYMGVKEVLTVDQYRVLKRLDGNLPADQKRVRTNLLKEDDDNIDKI